MKVSSTLIALICTAICASLFEDVSAAMSDHRYPHKYRSGGPPMPPRPPSLPSYVKKWKMPPPMSRFQQHRRPFPQSSSSLGFPPGKYQGLNGFVGAKGGAFAHPGITLQMQQQMLHQQQQPQALAQYLPLQHKGIASAALPPLPPITKPQPSKYEIPRQPQPSNSNIWSNYNQQQVKPSYNEVPKEKPQFLSSPQINTLDYDFHIQTNNIPRPQQLIKQIDDNNGPIHTIPAPKLSLADKPKNIDMQTTYKDLEYQASYPKSHHKQLVKPAQHKFTHVTIQKSHQYQVTEPPQPENNNHQQQKEMQQEQLQYQHLESLPQAQFLVQQPDFGLHHQQLPNPEVIGLFNAVPQQPLLDIYTVPLGQQHLSFETSAALPNYQLQLPKQPDYHSFNYQESEYNEQQQQQQPRQEIEIIYQQPRINNEEHQYRHQQSQDNSQKEKNVPYDIDFVHHFFSQQENAPAQLDSSQEYSQSKEDAIVNAFYSTLPNKEAAEALASLQEAGKLNSNSHIHQRSTQKSNEVTVKKASSIPMTIYVPDDFEDGEGGRQKSNISKKSITKGQEYYENSSASQEEESKDILDELTENKEFGERIKPKQ